MNKQILKKKFRADKFLIFLLLIFGLVMISSCDNSAVSSGGVENIDSEDTTAGTDGSESGSLSDFLGKTQEYMVKYKIESTGDTPSLSGEISYYMRGDDLRMDYSVEQAGQNIESRTYVVDDQMVSCMNAGSWNCYATPESEDAETSSVKITSEFDDLENNVDEIGAENLPSRKVAGVSAKCFSYEMGGAKNEICYSEKGVPLYMKMSSSGQTVEYVATDYDSDVSDEDFEYPSELQDMSGMMAGFN